MDLAVFDQICYQFETIATGGVPQIKALVMATFWMLATIDACMAFLTNLDDGLLAFTHFRGETSFTQTSRRQIKRLCMSEGRLCTVFLFLESLKKKVLFDILDEALAAEQKDIAVSSFSGFEKNNKKMKYLKKVLDFSTRL